MLRTRVTVLAALLASPALAVDPADTPPPRPTETTTRCENGEVWDPGTGSCTPPEEARLEDGALFDAARELAHAGRYDDADRVLDAVEDGGSGAVLTYRGFIARERGDWAAAQAFYGAALEADPDNFLARSYLGLGLLGIGDHDGARAQLSQIRARGGRNTWAEAALAMALAGGPASGY